MGASELNSEWQPKQQGFDDDRKGRYEYLELLRNEVVIRVVDGCVEFSKNNRDEAAAVEE